AEGREDDRCTGKSLRALAGPVRARGRGRAGARLRTALAEVLDGAEEELKDDLGVAGACRAVGASRASWHRRHQASPARSTPAPVPRRERVPPQTLTPAEADDVLAVLASDRYAEAAPDHVAAELVD